MSLVYAYEVLRRDGVFYAVAYWLALPFLLLAQFLGCGYEVYDPYKHVLYCDWQRNPKTGLLFFKVYPPETIGLRRKRY